ncbi:unnamed protein product [Rotaria socialis]|uniref:Cytochrome b561 domain-containing protein n=1 Tax=Rotaria socialis TaxID=392032 RepID=A0A817SMP4_9BILA|nr:unnamed protein product [Rotaria socialis]CAF3405840.1 unnamed protein product [Rotaria socialis]CAF4855769.1 unnamed protein product [Rotaria socialis]CAF4872343.1 unnamed protein product [Rotaria socialis]
MALLTKTPVNNATEGEDDTFENAHGTVMILAWMVFASTAVLFARYGRRLRFGSNDELFGEKIWFQVHRLIACLTTVLTLLGFFFILVFAAGGWVESDEQPAFQHSVLGGIIVCCALLQAWMALFRCHPDGSFRVIFNWLHRLTGLLAFFLSVPTIFLIISQPGDTRAGMIVILSLWSVWVVLIVIVLEIIRFRIQRSAPEEVDGKDRTELYDINGPPMMNSDIKDNSDASAWNKRILALFLLHFIVSIALAIPLISLVWQ